MSVYSAVHQALSRIPSVRYYGSVSAVRGLLIECTGLDRVVSVGSRCVIEPRQGDSVFAEVIGVREGVALLMPFTEVEGIGAGCRVTIGEAESVLYPDLSWKGRVINAFGQALDSKGSLAQGERAYPLKALAPPAFARERVVGKLDLGVRALNSFLTCCRGQRMGIFAGSGVGKSMLVAMLTKFARADVKVIGLVGERGREVQEFLEEYLGEEGLRNAVVVVATGDESALMRKQAAYATLAVAEYFRDQGQEVLCFVDSVTRFAMAQREIGLSAGEPPATKGYTPTVFAELPKLLERAGPGTGKGSITAFFSVLVEGDDHNEPIADAVRGILDGHIVLDRTIAERGRFPAVNILRSVSRTMPACNTDAENALVMRARTLLSTYHAMEDLIRLGAYRKGSDPKVDEAIRYYDALENFLRQKPNESSALADGYAALAEILEAIPS